MAINLNTSQTEAASHGELNTRIKGFTFCQKKRRVCYIYHVVWSNHNLSNTYSKCPCKMDVLVFFLAIYLQKSALADFKVEYVILIVWNRSIRVIQTTQQVAYDHAI